MEGEFLLPIPVADRSKARVCGRSLGLRVRNLLAEWMSVSSKCCQVDISATGRSLV
jgi:hypothetical protein